MHKQSLLRTLAVVGLLLVAGFLGLWYGPSPPGIAAPVRLQRDSTGNLAEDPPPSSKPFEVHAESLQANNSLTHASSTSSGDVARFALRRIVIYGLSDHALMRRVARNMLDELKQLDGVDEIRYLPPGYADEPGTRAPDMFVTLQLTKLTETGLLGDKLEAEVRMTASDQLARSNHSLIDHLTPPTLSYMSTFDLSHQSQAVGIHSSAAKYKLQADDMAKQLTGSLIKQIKEWRLKQGQLPPLPATFYPVYQAPPDLPLDGFSPRMLASHNGLWKHCEAFWRCRSEEELAATLATLKRRLAAADWKVEEFDASSTSRLAAQQGAWRLEAFADSANPTAERPRHFYVHVQLPITTQELDTAISQLVDDETPLETLLLVERHWNGAQQARILQRLTERPSTAPHVHLAIANTLDRLGQKDAAKLALRKGHALLFSVQDHANLESKFRAAAKRLGDEKLFEAALDTDMLDQMGFLAWPPASRSGQPAPAVVDCQFASDGALLIYHVDSSGNLHRFAVRASGDLDKDSLQLATAEARSGMQSWSSGMPVSSHHPTSLQWSLPDGVVAIDIVKPPRQATLDAKIRSASAKNQSASGFQAAAE